MLSGRVALPEVPASITAGKPYAVVVLLQLHWFLRLRWVFMCGALAALAVERFILPGTHRPPALLVAVLAVGASNLVWTGVSRLLRRQLEAPPDEQRRAVRSGQLFAGAQIASDLLLLTTPHDLFAEIDPGSVALLARRRLLMDTHGFLDAERWRAAGFEVRQLGTGSFFEAGPAPG